MYSEFGKQREPESEAEAIRNLPRALDWGVKGMMTSIRHHIAEIHRSGTTHGDSEADPQGMGVITLSGTNAGATMRVLSDQKPLTPLAHTSKLTSYLRKDEEEGDDGVVNDQERGTYVNSNFQAVNNSIMMDSTYSTNDPGVHLDISDEVDRPILHKTEKHSKELGKKKKNKAIVHDPAALSE